MGSGVREQTLRAALFEIERGLFHVRYKGGTVKDLPTYQVGTSALAAKQQIEQRALACGFDRVVWDDAPAAPVWQPVASAGTARPAAGGAVGD